MTNIPFEYKSDMPLEYKSIAELQSSEPVLPNPNLNVNHVDSEYSTLDTPVLWESVEQPAKFGINVISQVYQTDPQEYEVTIRVDHSGRELLEDIEEDIEKITERKKLLEQQEIISNRLDEIELSLKYIK